MFIMFWGWDGWDGKENLSIVWVIKRIYVCWVGVSIFVVCIGEKIRNHGLMVFLLG